GGAPHIEPNGLAQWDRVILRILPNDAARTAALLSGDVDVIENPSTPDIVRLKAQSNLQLAQVVSWRTLFWQLDQYRDASPFIT
ncbi:ABC transporter substrate-binding protein, partial [Acinetobacter baumannii]